jgi:hypothetical protein
MLPVVTPGSGSLWSAPQAKQNGLAASPSFSARRSHWCSIQEFRTELTHGAIQARICLVVVSQRLTPDHIFLL